jgi:biopolymer transport protein ExbD
MVITPLLQMGYDVKVPPKAQVDQPQSLVDQVIVSLTPQNQIYLNKQQVTIQQLNQQLGDILKSERNIILKGADAATKQGDVIHTMDVVRNAGAKNIGIVLETVPIQ